MWVIISFADTTEALDAQAYLLLYCGKGRVAADVDLDFCVVKINYFAFYDLMWPASLRALYDAIYLSDHHSGSLILSWML